MRNNGIKTTYNEGNTLFSIENISTKKIYKIGDKINFPVIGLASIEKFTVKDFVVTAWHGDYFKNIIHPKK